MARMAARRLPFAAATGLFHRQYARAKARTLVVINAPRERNLVFLRQQFRPLVLLIMQHRRKIYFKRQKLIHSWFALNVPSPACFTIISEFFAASYYFIIHSRNRTFPQFFCITE